MMPRSLSSSSKLALRSFGSLVMALALGAGGCASEDGDEEASATVTSALQAQSQGGVTDGVVDIEGTLAPEPEEAAAKVADFPTRGLEPAGCATKTRVASRLRPKEIASQTDGSSADGERSECCWSIMRSMV